MLILPLLCCSGLYGPYAVSYLLMNQRLTSFDYSFRAFLHHHVNGGMVLMVVALLAMVIANSPWAEAYHSFWNIPVALQLGGFNLFSHHGAPLTLMAFINDALMAVFFFSVGLEIKREILVGELSSLRQALLPIIAALGGMIFPVIFYLGLTFGTPAQAGLAIPMATDIAFSLGVLSLLGARVPLTLKIFLTAFAVVDDIGGILIIALCYTAHLQLSSLLVAGLILLVLVLANRLRVMSHNFYFLLGIVVWYLFLQSGVHATIAGVLVAFTIPSQPGIDTARYIAHIKNSMREFPGVSDSTSAYVVRDAKVTPRKAAAAPAGTTVLLTPHQLDLLKTIESASDHVISPLQSMEDKLHVVVNYVIMPLFAFANAGITLTGSSGASVGTVTLAVMLGLVLGKFVGIFLFTFLAVKSGLTALPEGVSWKQIAGVALLGGIGFTVALFIANLSFGASDPELLNQAKLGILLGTICAGILGYVVLRLTLPKDSVQDQDLLAR